MSSYAPGDTLSSVFGLASSTGAAINADSTPTLAVYCNDTLDGAVSPTLTNPSTGRYPWSLVIPGGYSVGDRVRVEAVAIVGGITLPPETLAAIRLDNAVASRAVAGDAMTLADGAITAAKLADGAITAAKIGADAITAAKLAADAVAEIQSGLSTLTEAAIRSAIGLASANLDTLIASLETNTNDLPQMIENDGLSTARFTEQALSQAPAGGGGGTGAVQLVFGPLTLYTEAAGSSQILRPQIGDTITVRGHLRDAEGDPISVVGATLTAALNNLAGEELLDLTVEGITEDEGVLDIELPLTDDALVAGRRYRLVVTRTLGPSVTNYPLSVVLEA